MSDGFFKIKKGLNLGVQASDPSSAEEGDFYTNSATNKIRIYVESSWRDSVTADQTQTLTNKSISGAVNTITAVPAANVVVTPSGNISSVNVQAALVEIQGDADSLSTDLTGHEVSTTVHGISGNVVGTSDSQTLTNKTISGASNTLSNIPNSATTATSAATVSTIVSRDGSANTAVNKLTAGAGSGAGIVAAAAGDLYIGETSGGGNAVVLGKSDGVVNVIGALNAQNAGNILRVKDGNFTLTDASDVTKTFVIDVQGTTGTNTTLVTSQTTNITVALPAASGSLTTDSGAVTLTNKKLVDASTSVVDSVDSTKTIKFDAGGTSGTSTTIAASQTSDKVVTLPNATTTLVGRDTTDVLTNKDIDGGTASNSSRITLPNGTLAAITALTRKAGTVLFATDTLTMYFDTGSALVPLASSVTTAPSGGVMAFAGTAAPTGWLLCDGSAVSRTTYASLFSSIGVNHGSGDGSTTFNLPDYKGRFLRGVDGGAGRDPDRASRTAMATGGSTGDSVGSVQSDDFLSHTHDVQVHNGGGGGNSRPLRSDGTTLISITGDALARGGNETRPINANVNWIIKT